MKRIPSLDGFRAISIIFVLAGHSVYNHSGRLAVLHHLSMLGVRIFFVISGFLITGILAEEIAERGTVNLWRFYSRRGWRLMPAFYTYLLFLSGMTFFQLLPIHLRDFIFAACYLMNYYPGGGPWPVGHFWSLAIEEQFYFLWPAVLLLCGLRRAPKALCLAIIAAPLVRLVLLPWKSALGPTYGTMFPTACDAVAVGCLLALFRERLHQNVAYLAFLRSQSYLLVFPSIVLLEFVLPGRSAIVIGPSLANFGLAVLIDGCITFPSFPAGRLLNWPPLVRIGIMSYSIYLWQQPFLNPEKQASWTKFPLNLALALICAAASYYLIEKPFLAFGRRDRRAETVPPLEEDRELVAD